MLIDVYAHLALCLADGPQMLNWQVTPYALLSVQEATCHGQWLTWVFKTLCMHVSYLGVDWHRFTLHGYYKK